MARYTPSPLFGPGRGDALRDRLPPSDSVTAMRFGFVLLIAGFLTACALPAAAQVPRPINALPPSVSASSPVSLASVQGADSEPDTTAPWRYFPLAVGNVWEYEESFGRIWRDAVVGDTTVLGRRYFVVLGQGYYEGGPPPQGGTTVALRFDTTSATVRALASAEDEYTYTLHCPFDAPLGPAECEGVTGPNVVRGTYDGLLVFGGDRPGTGTDTVRTAVKSFSTQEGFEFRYAADVGLAFEGGEGSYRALTYYRVGGEEHGVARFPVGSEPVGPEPLAAALDVWPNPARGRATVSVRLPGPSPQTVVAVYDVLGREVARLADGPFGPGRHPLAVDGHALPAGVYVVRATVTRESGASEAVVRRLTVVR